MYSRPIKTVRIHSNCAPQPRYGAHAFWCAARRSGTEGLVGTTRADSLSCTAWCPLPEQSTKVRSSLRSPSTSVTEDFGWPSKLHAPQSPSKSKAERKSVDTVVQGEKSGKHFAGRNQQRHEGSNGERASYLPGCAACKGSPAF